MSRKKRNKRDYGSVKFKVLLRILEIFHSYKHIKTGNLLRILDAEGLLSIGENKSSARRLLNYYLNELEYLGFIEKRGRGRNTYWTLKRGFIYDHCALLPHQKGIILLLLLIAEETFLGDLRGELENILYRLGIDPSLLEHLKRDIHFKYLYAVDVKPLLPLLGNIVEALQEGCYVQIIPRDENKQPIKLQPLGLGVRSGRLYLVALEGEKTVLLPLEDIKHISLLKWEKVERKHGPPRGGLYILNEGEKPFIFGLQLDVSKSYSLFGKNKPLFEVVALEFTQLQRFMYDGGSTLFGDARSNAFHPLVFHAQDEGNGKCRFYLVGFDSDYFAARFLPHLGEPLPPDGGMLKIARKKGLDGLLPDMPLSNLDYHRHLYIDFLKRLKKHLMVRLGAVKTALERSAPSR